MIKKFAINTKRYSDVLNSVMAKAEKTTICENLTEEKNHLFEKMPEVQDALLELDELLSDYYGEVLKIMYAEVVERIIRIFYSSDSSSPHG